MGDEMDLHGPSHGKFCHSRRFGYAENQNRQCGRIFQNRRLFRRGLEEYAALRELVLCSDRGDWRRTACGRHGALRRQVEKLEENSALYYFGTISFRLVFRRPESFDRTLAVYLPHHGVHSVCIVCGMLENAGDVGRVFRHKKRRGAVEYGGFMRP